MLNLCLSGISSRIPGVKVAQLVWVDSLWRWFKESAHGGSESKGRWWLTPEAFGSMGGQQLKASVERLQWKKPRTHTGDLWGGRQSQPAAWFNNSMHWMPDVLFT